jgi:hypothetical protein
MTLARCALDLDLMQQVRAAELLFIAVTCSLAGCAANTSLTGARSAGAMPKRCFWPPPRSTSLWTPQAISTPGEPSLAKVGGDLAVTLRRRGYLQQRWFPVGAGFVHGFAVATRLEHFDTEDGASELERWLPWHPEPANLFWLSGATTVRLPQPGHYRVFLFAFTDLPLGPTRVAPIWGKDTLMDGPEVPEKLSAENIPRGRHLRSARLGLYVYVYERPAGDDIGRFVLAEAPEQPRERSPTWISTEFTSQLEPLVSARTGGEPQ